MRRSVEHRVRSFLNFTWNPRGLQEKEEKEREKEKFAPGSLSRSVALKAGDRTQNRMKKVEIVILYVFICNQMEQC